MSNIEYTSEFPIDYVVHHFWSLRSGLLSFFEKLFCLKPFALYHDKQIYIIQWRRKR